MTESDRSTDDEQTPVDQMQHLRRLVVGPTNSSLEQLREQFADKQLGAEEVSRLLPEAIKRSTAEGSGLAKAIGPTFSAAFEESVKRDPQALANAVSPIMGPAIQRYIQQQIQAMVQTLNTAIDHSLSPKGLRWRLEAWKSGKPFAEVVLLHTLIYRIEQVMLIDPETGMLMQSASSSAVDDDADLVSSLLTAIQDFMRDSFRHRSDAGSTLQEIQTNELTVWMQHGPSAVIAVAIRGEPPLTLRRKLQALLDQIHVQYRPLLENFRGDTNPLELVRPDLEELLESEFVGKNDQRQNRDVDDEELDESTVDLASWWKQQLRWVLPTAATLLLVAWGWSRHREQLRQHLAEHLNLPSTAKLEIDNNVLRVTGSARHEWIDEATNRFELLPDTYQLDMSELQPTDQIWVDFLSVLEAEPGITVIRTKRVGNVYELHGWRDPNSTDPDHIRQLMGLSSEAVVQNWDLIRSSDPRVILKRLRASIPEFPAAVTAFCEHNSDTVFVQGVAPAEWIEELHQIIDDLQIDEDRFNLGLLIPENDAAVQ